MGKVSQSDYQCSNTSKRWLAFSLIELMGVVAIMGILVSLALPRFRTFVAKARMAEATLNLGVIKRLHKSYALHYQMFGKDSVAYNGVLMGNGTITDTCGSANLKNKLGFRVEDCDNLRYTYMAHKGNILGIVLTASGFGASTVISLLTASVNSSSSYATAVNDGSSSLKIYPNCSGSDAWLLPTGVGGGFGSSSELAHPIDVIEQCE